LQTDEFNEQDWYYAKELANILKVNYLTLIRWLNNGELKGIKRGRVWLIHKLVFIRTMKSAIYNYAEDGSVSEIWYTPEELANLMQVNYITVIRWLQSGDYKGIKLGRVWRVHESSFQRMLQKVVYAKESE
jgi:excisionase family DNA binding protein